MSEEMMKKIINEIIEFSNDMNRHNAAAFGSSIAFFFFLSIFPSLMFLCSLITYLPISEADISNFVVNLVPDILDELASSLVGQIYDTSKTTIPIFAFATLITAGMGIMGLIRGLNGVLDIEDHRNYFVLRAVATIYTLLMFVVLLLSIIILGFGKTIYHKLLIYLPHLRDLIRFIFKFRDLYTVVILFLFFIVIYTYLPAQKQIIKYQIPGAFIVSIGWWLVTKAFSIYVDYFNGFSIYGSLLGVMVVLFWLYVCFNLLIFGAYFNKYYKKQVKNIYRFFNERKNNRKIK